MDLNQDENFGTPIFCHLGIVEMFEYLAYMVSVEKLEKLSQFSPIKFEVICPCCLRIYQFRAQKIPGVQSPLYLIVTMPSGEVIIVSKNFGETIDYSLMCTFEPVGIEIR